LDAFQSTRVLNRCPWYGFEKLPASELAFYDDAMRRVRTGRKQHGQFGVPVLVVRLETDGLFKLGEGPGPVTLVV
jgi:hypothetical protein